MVELAGTVDAAQALRRIAAPLVATLQTFEQHGFAPFEPGFNARDALAQMAVTLSDGIAGIAQGVDRSGALLVQTDQGLQRVTSAEVSVRAQRRPDDSARPGY
ncbi:bifunctional ligase/repressor BirA [mine drainage metagenome]|uniref:Bifunctional ligase/repressor BirA n=1 Tax=mine drainage metagenome TaxID=410659 RepID=A0A1J5P6T4_9ZZZZ